MIKTLTIALIIAGLIIFFLILALIGQLDDLCEYEKKIKTIQEELEKEINIDDYYALIEREKRLKKIVGVEDKER